MGIRFQESRALFNYNEFFIGKNKALNLFIHALYSI